MKFGYYLILFLASASLIGCDKPETLSEFRARNAEAQAIQAKNKASELESRVKKLEYDLGLQQELLRSATETMNNNVGISNKKDDAQNSVADENRKIIDWLVKQHGGYTN
jgi:hypothetical protein